MNAAVCGICTGAAQSPGAPPRGICVALVMRATRRGGTQDEARARRAVPAAACDGGPINSPIKPNKISQPLAAIMAVFARVRARPRVRAPRGVDHRAGRRRLHEQHGEQAERQDSAAATAAAVPLAVPLVVMKMRRASAVALLVMKGAACRLPSLGIERRRRRRRLLCGGRRFAAPTLPTNARRRRTRLPRARSALAIGVHLSRTG